MQIPHIIVRSGPLRRTLYLTVIVALSVAVLSVTAVSSSALYRVDPSVAGALVAACGLGGFAGSVGVMIRPLRGDADKAMPVLALLVALALGGVLIAPGIASAAVAFAAAGILNSYFFAATLASRSEYSPLLVRSRVFVWVGALKITAGSAGTAAAGALITFNAHLPLAAAAVLTSVIAVIAVTDRAVAKQSEAR